MRKICAAVLLMLSLNIYAQLPRGQVITRDYKEKSYLDILGSPMLFEDWREGFLITKAGARLDKIKLNYDGYADEVIYHVDNQEFSGVSQFKEFVVFPIAGKPDTLKFRSGFKPIDENTENTFYQVLEDGNTALLKHYKKTVALSKDQVFVTNKKEFVSEDVLYVFKRDGTMVKLKKNKASVLEALSDKKDAVNDFITREKRNCKWESDLAAVIKFYNSI